MEGRRRKAAGSAGGASAKTSSSSSSPTPSSMPPGTQQSCEGDSGEMEERRGGGASLDACGGMGGTAVGISLMGASLSPTPLLRRRDFASLVAGAGGGTGGGCGGGACIVMATPIGLVATVLLITPGQLARFGGDEDRCLGVDGAVGVSEDV